MGEIPQQLSLLSLLVIFLGHSISISSTMHSPGELQARAFGSGPTCLTSRYVSSSIPLERPLTRLVPRRLRLRGGSDGSPDDDSPLLDDASEMEMDGEVDDLPDLGTGSNTVETTAKPVGGSEDAITAALTPAPAATRAFTKPRTVQSQPKRERATRNHKIRPQISRPLQGPIRFQLLDVDYTRAPPRMMQGSNYKEQFIVHAFGTTEEGNSVHVGLRGFLPYFFVNITSAFTEERCAEFIKVANAKLRDGHREPPIVRWERVERKNILGYRRAGSPFLKVFCSSPENLRAAASMIRNWDAATEIDGQGKQRLAWLGRGRCVLQTFETNVDPITRLSTDTNIVLSGWVEVQAGAYTETSAGDVGRSWCDLDLKANIADLRHVEGKEDVAPFLIGSFDIECVPEGGRGFPDARKPLDRCVQIGTAVYRFGEQAPCINVVMTLGTAEVEPECGVEIREFQDERQLLLAWQELVVHELDLDLLAGHNIFKFDLNYVAERAVVLKVPNFFFLGKLKGQATRIKSTERQSKAYGHNQFHYLPMTGRMQMDIYNLMTKNHKLSSYKLDSMAKVFLGDHKDDVSPKQIFQYQVKDAKHRGIVAKYCAKDCELVYKLIARLDYLPQYLEMSKVTGVTMNDLNTRGQQIKVYTQIVREARASGFVLPDQPRSGGPGGPAASDEVQYQGAFVLKPQRGLYQEPIATLDFASLYPSIIRGDNLSYETLVTDPAQLDPGVPVSRVRVENGAVYEAEVRLCHGSSTAMGAADDAQFALLLARVRPGMKVVFGTHKKTDAIEGPAYQVQGVEAPAIHLTSAVTSVQGEVTVKKLKLLEEVEHCYVQHVEGILPRICKNLLTARKKAKKEMATTDDPVRKGLLNGKQLALKVSCNSVYGFTGAGKGMLPCLPIASSVTAIGQQMIKTTKSTVEELYNATVIYGDTDSVMVNFHCGEGPEALARALDMGGKAAKAVTSKFKPPNELEFEKVYMPYILYSKKRYAGQMYTRADKPDKIDIKGLQVVRRDNSQLARDIMKALINTMVTPITAADQSEHPGLSKADITRHKIKSVVHSYLDDLVDNRYSLDKFVISQSIAKKSYDENNSAGFKSASLGHVKLAERMERREPGTGPVTGDRVPFVVVKEAPHLVNFTNRTICGVTYAAKDWPPRHERCEDPVFVKEQGLTVDLEYYLANQLKNPIVSLLEPLYQDKTDQLFAAGERKLKNKCSGNAVLTSFFTKKPAPACPDKRAPAAAAASASSVAPSSAPAVPASSGDKETSRSVPLHHFFRKRGPLSTDAQPQAKHAAR